jgi:hypothetical protein
MRSIYMLAFSIFVIVVLNTGSLRAGFDIESMMGGPGKQIFPEPQNKIMNNMREPFDRVIYLFRAWAESSVRAKDGSSIDRTLCTALEGLHREECWLFTKSLTRTLEEKKSKAVNKWIMCLENLSLKEDIAAFNPVFERLPEELASSLASFRKDAEAMTEKLASPSALSSYATQADFDKEFFKKKRPWQHLSEFIENGVEGLLLKLEERFCKENLIRFFSRIQGWDVQPVVKEFASRTEAKLFEALRIAIENDFDDRIEGGLGHKTQVIELRGEFVMTKTSLHNGRLRFFIKKITAFEDSRDIKLFLPTLTAVKRHANTVKLHSQNLEAPTQAYLKEVCENLDTMNTILMLKARKDSPANSDEDLFKSIRSAINELDTEGLFSGL